MVCRTFALILSCVLLVPASARSQEREVFTADEAVELALRHPAIADSLEARIAEARASLEESVQRPEPQISLSNDQIYGRGGLLELELGVGIQQQIDVVDWRSRLRGVQPHREAAMRAAVEGWRLEVATQVRAAYFEVRYRQERREVLGAWIARLEEGVAAIEAREARGDASEYDVKRVERELRTVRAELAREDALLSEAWANLMGWTAWEERPDLTGALTPGAPAPRPAKVILPEQVRLQQMELEADAEIARWGQPWSRGWTVGGGYLYRREDASNGHGFSLSLQVPLIVRNNDLARRDRLQARKVRLGGERQLARTLAERQERAAAERLEGVLETLEAFPPLERDDELTAMAEIAYGAGEASLLDLLDAYSSEARQHLSRVDLEWEARRASLELDRRRGIGAPKQ